MPLQRSTELEQLAQEAHEAYERGDADWFSTRMSAHGPVMLGTAPAEEMAGADAIDTLLSEELANPDTYEFKRTPPRIIDAREVGDRGWILNEARWEIDDGS